MRTLFVLLLAAGAAAARDKPKDVFDRLQEAAEEPLGVPFRSQFAADAFAGMAAREVEQALRELGRDLYRAAYGRAREEDEEAAVSFKPARDKKELRELLLAKEGREWKVRAPRSYAVAGPELERRRGAQPVDLTLAMRKTNGPYGDAGFSFTHVTADPGQCKNRMDVWFCHNGDLHAVGASRIADVGKASLAKQQDIPVGAAWGKHARAEKGRTYVLHCANERRMDFYVKLRVGAVKEDAVELEWTLLTDGLGAPPDLKGPHPLVSNDGADGTDGLCGRGR